MPQVATACHDPLSLQKKMQHTSSAHSRVAERLGVLVLTFAAVALLGAVLAYWTWRWIAPRAEPPAAVTPQAQPLESAQRLFGGARAAPAPAQAGFVLIGVAANPSGGGVAIINHGVRTVVVRTGEEAAPEVRVAEVRATHVVLDRGGRLETLELPKRRK